MNWKRCPEMSEPPPTFQTDVLLLNTSSSGVFTPSPFSKTVSSSRGPQCSPGCRGAPTHQTPKCCFLDLEGPTAKPWGRLLRARMAGLEPGGQALRPWAKPFPKGLHPEFWPRGGSGAAGRREGSKGAAHESVGLGKDSREVQGQLCPRSPRG